jgi:hypothetical protein
VIRVVWFKAGTEGFEKHGQTEKRPGNRDKRQPFGVMTSDGHFKGIPRKTRKTRKETHGDEWVTSG